MKNDIKNCNLSRAVSGGYIDKFNNVWEKPRGIIQGEFHWDVQLSNHGKICFGWLGIRNHLNVKQNGEIPH